VPAQSRHLASVPADTSDRVELPAGVDPKRWRQAGGFGTDGDRTYRLEQTGWKILADVHVQLLAERVAAVDPDFPERDEDAADDSREAGADVSVAVVRGGQRREKVYRNVKTSDLRKCVPLDRFGPSAWRSADSTGDARAKLFRAFNDLSQEAGVPCTEFYTVTGWHPGARAYGVDAGQRGEMFVHGGGAIDAHGLVDVDTRLGDHMTALRLGEPAAGAELVDAFGAVLALVDSGAMPGRVLWPLVAAALRPVFGQYRDPRLLDETSSTVTAWVSGGTGAIKSGSTAAALNVLYPGLTYNTFPVKAGTAKNGGASGPGLERLLFRARDLCVPFDDLDPSEPDAVRAAWQSDLIRRAAGQYGRLLAQQKTGDNRAAMPCRAGVLGTGEPLDAEASAENRAVNVVIGEGDVRLPALKDHTTVEARTKRAGFGAGLVKVLAADRQAYRARLAAARVALRPMYVAGDAPGPVQRGADTFAELSATLRVALGVLVDSGMPAPVARGHWTAMVAELREAWRAHLVVIGGSDRGTRAVTYLRQALGAGLLRIDDRGEGSGPSRDRYGWDRVEATSADSVAFWRSASNTVGGWQDADTGDLLLLPSVVTGAVRTVAERAGDSWTGGTKALGSALKGGGFLAVAEGRAERGAATERPRIAGVRREVWHLIAERYEDAGGVDYAGTEYGGAIGDLSDSVGSAGVGGGSAGGGEIPRGGSAGGSAIPALTWAGGSGGSKTEDQPHGDTRPKSPCVICPEPGEFCGQGGASRVKAPCVCCGVPTYTRAACGAARTGVCHGKPAQRAAEPAGGAGGTSRTPDAGKGAQRAAQRARRPIGRATPPDRAMRLDPSIEAGNLAAIVRQKFPEPDREALLEAVDRFHRVTDWTAVETKTPGMLGNLVLHRLTARSGSTPELERVDMPEEVTALGARGGTKVRMLDPRWVNRDRVIEPGAEIVGMDVSGQFLGAAGDELGTGVPVPIKPGTGADQAVTVAAGGKSREVPLMRLPGYGVLAHDLDVTAGDVTAVPGILRDLKAGDTVAMPTVRMLADDLGLPVELAGGWVWESSRRWLGDWQRFWRDARTALIEAGPDDLPAVYALAAVKSVTNAFLGGWLRSPDHNRTASLRVDWAHQVIARARMNALRGIGKASAEPVAIVADTAFFLGHGELGAMRVDDRTYRLGSWKTEKRVTATAAIVAAYGTGRPNKFRDAINAEMEAGR